MHHEQVVAGVAVRFAQPALGRTQTRSGRTLCLRARAPRVECVFVLSREIRLCLIVPVADFYEIQQAALVTFVCSAKMLNGPVETNSTAGLQLVIETKGSGWVGFACEHGPSAVWRLLEWDQNGGLATVLVWRLRRGSGVGHQQVVGGGLRAIPNFARHPEATLQQLVCCRQHSLGLRADDVTDSARLNVKIPPFFVGVASSAVMVACNAPCEPALTVKLPLQEPQQATPFPRLPA